MAIGCPYGGDDQQGLVLIYNGHAEGLVDQPTQTLSGQWASNSFPATFGFALRGDRDLDQNGYPGTSPPPPATKRPALTQGYKAPNSRLSCCRPDCWGFWGR